MGGGVVLPILKQEFLDFAKIKKSLFCENSPKNIKTGPVVAFIILS